MDETVQREPNFLRTLSVLHDAGSFSTVTTLGASIMAGRAQIGGRYVWMAATDSRVARGAFSVADCQVLVQLFDAAQSHAEPVILLLNSAGLRVDQGLAALGAFRSVCRQVIAASVRGVSMLACVGHDCFGGASTLAMLAQQRVYARNARLSLSGPRVIEAFAGRTLFDASDSAAVSALMGATARSRWHDNDVIANFEPLQLRRLFSAWLGSTGPHFDGGLVAAHERLSLRLRNSGLMVHPGDKSVITTDARTFQRSLQSVEADLVGEFCYDNPAYIGVISRESIGVVECWTLADVLLDLKERQPGRPVLLALDMPSHSVSPRDEQILLSKYVVHVALVLMHMRNAGHPIRLVLIGRASGAVYVALSAGVHEVLATRAARVQVLSPQALQNITASRQFTGSSDLVLAGVADRLID